MNWTEFARYLTDHESQLENPPELLMSGVQGDNATKYLEDQKGTNYKNNHAALLRHGNFNRRDFVCSGSDRVRVMGPMQTGGHPALAGFDSVYCAGIVRKGYFFFHSGHYHPKAEHARLFLLEFVRNSCAGVTGHARDQLVDQLCSTQHQLYWDHSTTETYFASLADLLGATQDDSDSESGSSDEVISSRTKTKPMGIGSKPISLTRSTAPKSIVIPSSSLVADSGTRGDSASATLTTTLDLGLSRPGQHLISTSTSSQPKWLPDSAATKCLACGRPFTMFLRRHHCRQCGGLFCDDCSKGRKAVARPAVEPGKSAETGQLRVCDNCLHLTRVASI